MARTEEEERICSECASFLAFMDGKAFDGNLTYPDSQERNDEAVDALFALDGRRHWLELTRIEPFPDEILDGKKLLKVASLVEQQLQAPRGRYRVSFEVGAFAGVSMRQLDVNAQSIVHGLQSALHQLAPGEERRLRLAEVAGDVVVEREERFHKEGVFISRNVLPDLEQQRAHRAGVAVEKKLPKLLRSASNGDAAVLLFHSHDISLSNVHLIAEAFRAVTGERPPVDELVVLETEIPDTPLWYSVVSARAYRPKYHAHVRTAARGWMPFADVPL